MPAGVEDLKHGPPLPVKGQPVVELHLPGKPRVVARRPVQKMRSPLHHGRDALAPALVKDGRVRHSQDHPPFQQRVVLLCLPDAPCLLHRVDAQPLVGPPRAAVQLLDAVQPPFFVRRVPPYGEGLRVAEIVSPPDLPVPRDAERLYHVGPPLVFVVVRVVPPFGEHLPRKTVPAAVQQGLFFRLGQTGQRGQIPRVVAQQGRVVKHAGGDEHPGPLQHFWGAVRQLHRELLHDRRAGRRRGDEPCLHPAVSHPAGVGGGPQVHPGAGACGAVAAHHVAVLFPLKMGQLVKPDEIEGLALVVGAVLGKLHGAKVDLRPAGEHPHMARGVILGSRVGPAVVPLALVHQVGELGVGLAEDESPVMGDLHLP